jgi:hypothetical protein|nr:MAG TPA: hypothetical protein [Caudoviricetes sp.]
MITSLLKLCTEVCSKILYDDSPDRKILDNYTREELDLIIERIKEIRRIFKIIRLIRANIVLFKFQEMIHKVIWTLNIYDIEVVAYELENYIMNDMLYNDLKEAMDLDMKLGNPILRKTDYANIISNLFKNSLDTKLEDDIPESLMHINTEYIRHIPDIEIEVMNNNKLVRRIAQLMFVTDTILDHIKERLK